LIGVAVKFTDAPAQIEVWLATTVTDGVTLVTTVRFKVAIESHPVKILLRVTV